MTNASLATLVFRWLIILAVGYIAWHLWLAYGLHQTPDEFLAGIRQWLQGIGNGLVPDLEGAI